MSAWEFTTYQYFTFITTSPSEGIILHFKMRKLELREVLQNWDLKSKMSDFNPTLLLLQNWEGVCEDWKPRTRWLLESQG